MQPRCARPRISSRQAHREGTNTGVDRTKVNYVCMTLAYDRKDKKSLKRVWQREILGGIKENHGIEGSQSGDEGTPQSRDQYTVLRIGYKGFKYLSKILLFFVAYYTQLPYVSRPNL